MTVEYLLFDLPSDHEVEENVVTECDVIRAIVSNKGQGKKVKMVRATTKTGFTHRRRSTTSVKYVHLAGHGDKTGLGLIRGSVDWKCTAEQITKLVPRLKGKQRRVLCISCCYSKHAADKMSSKLEGYFTATYFFHKDNISFATAMTVWSMFYHEKTLDKLHKKKIDREKIVDRVNEYLDDKVLAFRTI